MTLPLSSAYQPALAALHAEKPLRVWSLIVTMFGDLVMNKGLRADPPTMWIAPMLELLELLGIDGALARTNFSRLVANGTLVRTKVRRNTFYRLSETSRTEFIAASKRIYGRNDVLPTEQIVLAVIDRCLDRNKARAALTQAGFSMIGPTVALSSRPLGPGALTPDIITTIADPSPALQQTMTEIWKIDKLNAAYRTFIEAYTALDSDTQWSPAEAVTARIAMVHHFRRIVLRDPHLGPALLPAGWTGAEARKLFNSVGAKLEPASSQWQRDAGFYRHPAT